LVHRTYIRNEIKVSAASKKAPELGL